MDVYRTLVARRWSLALTAKSSRYLCAEKEMRAFVIAGGLDDVASMTNAV